jgi:hypothetical protein
MADTLPEFGFKCKYEIFPLLDEYRKDGIINASKDDINNLLSTNDA